MIEKSIIIEFCNHVKQTSKSDISMLPNSDCIWNYDEAYLYLDHHNNRILLRFNLNGDITLSLANIIENSMGQIIVKYHHHEEFGNLADPEIYNRIINIFEIARQWNKK